MTLEVITLAGPAPNWFMALLYAAIVLAALAVVAAIRALILFVRRKSN